MKSRNLVLGVDNVKDCKGRIYAIFYDGGLSEGSLKRLTYAAEERKIPLILSERPIEEIVHKSNCKAAGLTDKNMYNGIKKYLQNNKTFIVINGGQHFE